MEKNKKQILIYIPMRNTAGQLEATLRRIPAGIEAEYLAVDNGSKDNSVELANNLGLHVIRHHFDRGYGASQKTAYSYALGKGADFVVMLHSDGQYDPKYLPDILGPLLKDEADFVFGSRIKGKGALAGGMPSWKYISNLFLTRFENFILGSSLSEFHSGYRAFSMKLLERVPFLYNSDSWLFDSEIIFQIKNLGFRIKEIPISTSYHKGASSVGFFEGVEYGLSIFWLSFKYLLHRYGIIKQKQFM
ncbi:MAG: glycosyltransferase family 2 protein [Candidatus Omnitrophica bacterium]|nr:glycosyltransferase family 2 protein [Candidatus Omnitrophota bacterium]